VPTTNDATAYSSNDVVNAIRTRTGHAGRINGKDDPRTCEAGRAEIVRPPPRGLTSICCQPRDEHEDRVRQRDHDVADHHRQERALTPRGVKRRGAARSRRRRRGSRAGLRRSADSCGLRPKPAADERDRGQTMPRNTAAALDRRDDRARPSAAFRSGFVGSPVPVQS
jgi:hypothetical protein